MEQGTVRGIDPIAIISKFYDPGSVSYAILVEHGKAVTKKAIQIAGRLACLNADVDFIEGAAMLHDIGIFMTNAPGLGCFGANEYICHGYLGRELLEAENLDRHALVCERHVGAGISIEDIDSHRLPIPRRQMIPLSVEEKIICYADKFFSKRPGYLSLEKPIEEVRTGMKKYGADSLRRFDEMHELFSR